jgi:U3 small nucleolar ribonucleoprotein protein IMP4
MCSSLKSGRDSRRSVSHPSSPFAYTARRGLIAAYEIRQGTVDQKEADVEWLLRPYMRTAKKRTQL